jgi:hypothetical protein
MSERPDESDVAVPIEFSLNQQERPARANCHQVFPPKPEIV